MIIMILVTLWQVVSNSKAQVILVTLQQALPHALQVITVTLGQV